MELLLDDKADALIDKFAFGVLDAIYKLQPDAPKMRYAGFEISRKSPEWKGQGFVAPAFRWLILRYPLLEPPSENLQHYMPVYQLTGNFEDRMNTLIADTTEHAMTFVRGWPKMLAGAPK